MITYELVKQLKEAGFPMNKALPDSRYIWGGTDTGGTVYEYPTLSELIEACGDKFSMLHNCGNIWKAFAVYAKEKITQGSTPEEAVAKLWLELNSVV